MPHKSVCSSAATSPAECRHSKLTQIQPALSQSPAICIRSNRSLTTFFLLPKENHQAAQILRLRKCWGTISSQSNIRKHESGSRSVGATTAGLSQLDGASLLSVTQAENRSTQRELEEETEEGGRGDARSPECFVMFGTNVLHLTSLLVCTHFMIHFRREKKEKY